MTTNYCPGCGQANVSVGLNQVLIETAPRFRFHACGIGGPGGSGTTDRERRYHESNQWGR